MTCGRTSCSFPGVCSAAPWRFHQSEWEFEPLMSLQPRGTTLPQPRDEPHALSKAHKSQEVAMRSNAYLSSQYNKWTKMPVFYPRQEIASASLLSHCLLSLLCKGFVGRDANQEQTEFGWVSANKNTLSSKRGFFTPDTSLAPQQELLPPLPTGACTASRSAFISPCFCSPGKVFCEGRSVLIVSLAASSLHR